MKDGRKQISSKAISKDNLEDSRDPFLSEKKNNKKAILGNSLGL